MGYICLITSIIVSSVQVFSADYDEEKTSMLQRYLTSKVDNYAEKGELPEPDELRECITTLVEQGANLHVGNAAGTGTCALHFAAEAGSVGLCQFLIERNAHLDVVDDLGRTPLHFACWRGHEALVDWFLQALANKEAVNDDGYTPLMVAVMRGHDKILRRFLEGGANVEVANRLGVTALEIAFNCRNEEAILAMLSFGAHAVGKNFNLLERAQNIALWHLPCVSEQLAGTFFERIYAFPEGNYLKILDTSCPLFKELPLEIKLYIIRWILMPWTF